MKHSLVFLPLPMLPRIFTHIVQRTRASAKPMNLQTRSEISCYLNHGMHLAGEQLASVPRVQKVRTIHFVLSFKV